MNKYITLSKLAIAIVIAASTSGCGVGSSIPADDDFSDTTMQNSAVGTNMPPPEVEDDGHIGPLVPVTPVIVPPVIVLPPPLVCGNIDPSVMQPCAGGN
jgi:hypothetical protein